MQVVTICYIRVTRDIVTSEFTPDHVSGHWPDWPRNICHIFTSASGLAHAHSLHSSQPGGRKMMISQLSSFPHHSSIGRFVTRWDGSILRSWTNLELSIHKKSACLRIRHFYSSRFSNAVFQIITCSNLLKCQQTASLVCSTFPKINSEPGTQQWLDIFRHFTNLPSEHSV